MCVIQASHTDYFMSKYSALESSATRLSATVKLLPCVILLSSVWHAGYILETYITINIIYNVLTTIYESISTQKSFFGRKYVIYYICCNQVSAYITKITFSPRSEKTFKESQKVGDNVYGVTFPKIYPACQTDDNGIKPGSNLTVAFPIMRS